MRRFLILLLLVCVFVAGVFVGLWSVWKQNPPTREMKYALQDNNTANLLVGPGDTVSLVSGGSAKVPKLNFFAGSPCTGNSTPDKCQIDGSAAAGTYPFTCGSQNGYDCLDPAIQQKPTGPLQGPGFLGFAKTHLLHLVGVQPSPTDIPKPAKAPGGHAATSSFTAYLTCTSGATALYDSSGKSLTTINASVGESVFWSSPPPFTLDSSKFPANLCSNGNPTGGSGSKSAECDVNMTAPNVPYTAQVQGCGQSGPLTLIAK